MLHYKTLTGLDRWRADLQNTRLHYIARVVSNAEETAPPVCVVSHIPRRVNEDGDIDIDRHSYQWKNLTLIAHATDLLDTVRRVLWDLAELIDGDAGQPDEQRPSWRSSRHRMEKLNAMLATEENHQLWVKLCEIQRELQDAEERATDTENF